MNKLCDDTNKLILSFLIEEKKPTEYTYITNDIIFLDLTSKNWNQLIKKYKNNKSVKFVNKIEYASENGHANVLEWLQNIGYEFKVYNNAVNYASENGHVNVLEWWKNSGYELKYDERAINIASKYGCVEVLEWFDKLCENSDYEFKYDEDAINNASRLEQIHVLDWWKNSGYEFKHDWRALMYADDCVLDWYKKNVRSIPVIEQEPEHIHTSSLNYDYDFDY